MAGPFYNAIKGTTAVPPLMAAFIPNAASSGFLAWSAVPAGWIGLVRYEDGAAWELQYSYWNGTTLSRAATTQFVSSSSGSALTLTSAATAAMIADANEISPHPMVTTGKISVVSGTAGAVSAGLPNATLTGTGAGASIAATNYLTEQARVQYTSVTTANGQSGVSIVAATMLTSTAAGRGGWEICTRFGGSVLVTGQRMFAGATSVTRVASTAEPSALVAHTAGLGLDSTDTNFQFLTNSNAGAGTKIDTGIAFVANGWYEVSIWTAPGSTTVFVLLLRLDTGAIYYGSTSTDVPGNGALLFPQCIGGLSATTGTAFVLQFGGTTVRNGAG